MFQGGVGKFGGVNNMNQGFAQHRVRSYASMASEDLEKLANKVSTKKDQDAMMN